MDALHGRECEIGRKRHQVMVVPLDILRCTKITPSHGIDPQGQANAGDAGSRCCATLNRSCIESDTSDAMGGW